MSLETQSHENPIAIHWQLGAIFVSLELSRSKWLITSLSPGGGEKMSKHVMAASDLAGLLALLQGLRAKARERDWRGLLDDCDPGGWSGRVLDTPIARSRRDRELRS